MSPTTTSDLRPEADEPRRSRTPGAVGLVAVLVTIGSILLGIGAVVSTRSRDDATSRTPGAEPGPSWHGTVLASPQPRPDFTLTDTAGRPYDFATATEGRLTLLFFGYTSCPDVCPIHMATLSAALDQPDMPTPVVVFVTSDPERDTPERLRSWLDGFSPDIVGLRGTEAQVRAAEVAAGVAPSARATGEGDDYEVGHAAQVLAYTADDDLAHVAYPFGTRREDWLADLPRLARGWEEAS